MKIINAKLITIPSVTLNEATDENNTKFLIGDNFWAACYFTCNDLQSTDIIGKYDKLCLKENEKEYILQEASIVECKHKKCYTVTYKGIQYKEVA